MKYDIGSLRARGLRTVKKHEPGLVEVVQGNCYTDIFNELRKCPKGVQKNIITEFYRDFPNGGEVAKRIYRINNIPWLSAEHLRGHTDDVRHYFSEHLERLQPFYKGDVSKDWHAALDDAWYAVWDTTSDADLDATRDADLDADESAASCVGYEIFSDILKMKNPWDPLIDIYEKGFLIRTYRGGVLSVVSRKGTERLKI